MAYGRVYLQYHTMRQIVAGGVLGASLGVLWFLLVHLLVAPFIFPIVADWSICQLLLIKVSHAAMVVEEGRKKSKRKKRKGMNNL